MRRLVIFAILLCCTTRITFAFDSQANAWKKIILQCASSELLASHQVYYIGASNQIGPGSVWQRNSAKGLDLYFPFTFVVRDADQRSQILTPGADVNCSSSAKSGWNIKLGLPFSSNVVPISGDLQVALSHAKNVSISIDSYAIDTLALGIWSYTLGTLPNSDKLMQQLYGRYLAKSGVRVKGMKTTFEFDHDLSADVQAKFQGTNFSLGSGQGASLHAELTGKRQITVSSPGTSYILIDLGKISSGAGGAEADSALSSDGSPEPSAAPGFSVSNNSDLPADMVLGPKKN